MEGSKLQYFSELMIVKTALGTGRRETLFETQLGDLDDRFRVATPSPFHFLCSSSYLLPTDCLKHEIHSVTPIPVCPDIVSA